MDIAIPSSSLINEGDEKIKTFKVGIIGRAATVFRVRTIYIYRDPLKDESKFMKEILEYMETPQYLRKYLFPLKDSLRYAGVLPPLQIPSHKPKSLKIGEIREGVVVKVAPDGTSWVDIGLKALALFRKKAEKGARVTVRICSKNPLVVEEAKPQEYWGYKVKITELEELVKRRDAIITSRRGRIPSMEEFKKVGLLIFGNPKEGVPEIAERMGIDLGVDMWNMIPNQGSKTVRLEEALISCLALVNYAKVVL
uniref:RNA-binding protein n=1 Tax=Geoglobus ahangari TaxID=113653 RepID=A0A7C4S5P9_9EURY